MTLIFWQNILSQLQAPYIISIKKQNPTFDITYVAEVDVNESRKKLGWTSLKESLIHNEVECIIAPSANEIINIFEKVESIQSYHFFSGLTGYKLVKNAFEASKSFSGVNRYLIAEGPFFYKIPKQLHFLKALILEKRNYKFIKSIFTIGKSSADWYQSLGFTRNQIIPFSYVVQKPVLNSKIITKQADIPLFTFVGNLIHRKGVDIAIKAFSQVNLPFKFNIIGDGDERLRLEELVNSLNLSNSIKFLGVQKSNDIYNYLQVSDFLILPSRHDGWGAVINEGLMCGAHIISTNACGAQELISEGFNGRIFDIKSQSSLTKILLDYLQKIDSVRENSNKIQSWSENIGADVIAQYFVNCLTATTNSEHVPPWRK
jgi:glycosyltransferase involved in cell wall biosynthesis